MRKVVACLLLTLLTVSMAVPPAQAYVRSGAECSKMGMKQVHLQKIFTCIKSEKRGKKLVWDAGTLLGWKCIPGSDCPIGSIGPGGGVVIYDAGSQQSWGQYLEVAPYGWSWEIDPPAVWCDLHTNVHVAALGTALGVEIGTGKANTDLMVASCHRLGAGNLARAYKGGGKSDWSLPSMAELNEVCKYARGQFPGNPDEKCNSSSRISQYGFISNSYWSSSEYDEFIIKNGKKIGFAGAMGFANGHRHSARKPEVLRVRPVRTF